MQPEDERPEHPDADLDAVNVSELLDGITNSYGRAQLGLRQALDGDTILLDEL